MVDPGAWIPADDAAGTSLAWLGDAGRSLRTLAVIWATVDLERARVDLERAGVVRAAERPGTDTSPVEDPQLGARVVVLPAAGSRDAVALAEPSTEGRLAGTLARHGEGPAGRYVLAPAGLAAVRTLAIAAGIPISGPAIGPFGPSVLVLAGRVAAGVARPHPIHTGPYLVLVDPPGILVERAAVPSRS